MFEKIKSIKKTEIRNCYDIKMQNTGFRAVEMPDVKSNFIANNIVCKNSGGDARSSFALTDSFEEFAEAKEFKKKNPLAAEIAIKLEGMVRSCGTHAAAMVLSGRKTDEFCPINKIGGIIACQFEKQQVEDINLIKFDILGLKTLSVLKDVCESAKIQLPKDFNDKNVYEKVFKGSDMLGCFQFQTTGMQKFCSQLNISNFNELSDATTLFRPGALHSGQAQLYSNRKNGQEKVEYFHPLLESITKQTQGTILYQEQIMRIFHELGSLSWSTSEMARKVITKSKGKDAFEKMRKEFVQNAVKINHLTEVDAERLYDTVSTFGSYSFNKTHAYGYSMISYCCAWLKTYHPLHFYKSLLKFESDEAEIKNYIQDAKRHGITFEYPDINKSFLSYEISDGKIYAGINSIIGIGDKVAEKIMQARPFKSYQDFVSRVKVSEKILKGLIVADAFREFKINKKDLFNNLESKRDHNQKLLFAEEVKKQEDFTDTEWSQLIYQHTTLQPKIEVTETFDFGDLPFISINQLTKHPNEKVILRGIVTAVLKKDKLLRGELKKHTMKYEQRLLYLNLTDGTENVAVQINPETFEILKDKLEFVKNKPVVIFGSTSKDGKKVFADLLDIAVGEHKTESIKELITKSKTINLTEKEAFIFSARPAVSKNNKSYYRMCLSNGVEGLCFRFEDKLIPGLKVKYNIKQEPFIDITVLKS